MRKGERKFASRQGCTGHDDPQDKSKVTNTISICKSLMISVAPVDAP